MASVFPWTAESPLIAAILFVATTAYIVILAWGYHAVRRILDARAEAATTRPGLLGPRTWEHARTALFWASVAVTAYGLLYAGGWAWQPIRDVAFPPAFAALPSILLLSAILLGTAIALEVVRQLASFLRGELPRKPVRKLSPQVVNVLQLFLRYLVYLSAGIGLAVVALGALGYQDAIVRVIAGWFAAQAGALLLLAVLVGVGWAGGRILRALTADIGRTSRRLSPEVVQAMGGAARGALYAFLGIIAIFTLLSAVGLGAIGGTIVIVLSTFIGLVVAMAATGSIGNALAGLVLLAFRPLARGERVVVAGDLVGDVEEVSLMITRIRTVPGEVVDVPNNLVLLHRIKNLSRSGKHAIVVKLGIGYDVSHALVRRLALDGASKTKGIVTEPASEVYATNFGNYAIEYELHAFTAEPRHVRIRSELLGNLQESFYGAGVEIMTPDIYVIRRGKQAEPEGAVTLQVQPASTKAEPRA